MSRLRDILFKFQTEQSHMVIWTGTHSFGGYVEQCPTDDDPWLVMRPDCNMRMKYPIFLREDLIRGLWLHLPDGE
jgi:hypothetical protein